ncbi:MAG: cytochrome P450 [bacterium]|nr:cytochrome P450 [bacterium]MDE0287517.1 cytochrome P450 [bacterium]MDE0437756.1 cytochrome P450 [bacterium]
MPEFFDPSDRSFIDNPYPTLNALREQAPLHRDTEWNLWLVTRYADVRAVQLNRRLGRVKQGHALPSDLRPIRELGLVGWEPYYQVERYSLLMLEPPEHTRLRSLVNRAFTPRRVRELRDPITAIADELLEGLKDRPSFDLLGDYAQPYSVRVIATLLGAPVGDADLLLDWSHAIVKMYELHTTHDQARAAIVASGEFSRWVSDLMARRRAEPRDDLITALCLAETAEGRLTDPEIVSTVVLLLNAGHEATVNTMGNGIVAALRNGDAWRQLVERSVQPATAIEEMMRFDPPLQLFERYVLAEGVEIAGTPIPPGDKVAVLFGSANRDPRRFEAPDEFRIGRGDPDHITFGAGVHFCLGAPLARLELEIAVDRLTRAFPGARLAAEPRREDGFVIRGYETVKLARS